MTHKTILKFIVVIGIMILATMLIGATKVNAFSKEDVMAEDKFNIIESISVSNDQFEHLQVQFSLEKLYDLVNNKTDILEQNVQDNGMIYDYLYLKVDDTVSKATTNIEENYEIVTIKGIKYCKIPIHIAFKSDNKFYTSELHRDINFYGSTNSYIRYDAGFDYMTEESKRTLTGAAMYLTNSLKEADYDKFEQKYPTKGQGDEWGGQQVYNRAIANEEHIYFVVKTKIDMGKTIKIKPMGTLNYIETIKDTENEYIYKYATEITDKNFFNKNNIFLELLEKNAYCTYEFRFEGDTIDITKEVIKTDTTTNIKLETTSNVVPENTQLEVKKLTTGNTYSIVEKAINNEVSKFVLYDITLKSNNTTIQPNGKVKISIPIPNGYDTSKIIVYRIAEDGAKTKYDTTINNGYVTFETNHFSNYVVAEEITTTNNGSGTTTEPTETQKQPTTKPTTSGKLDDTPKTGADNTMSVISSIVSVLSIIGIAILKKF